MPKLRMHLGLDDTDSARNGCTTYIAALLVEKLEKLKVKFLDYPNLVRLNPNVPWKTRGNGALCLRFEYDEEIEGEIKEAAVSLLEEQADLNCKGTDPGIIFFKESQIPQKVKNFARNAITGIVTLKEATNIIKAFKGEALGYNTCRGIIGALAAVGENLEGDYTYELIAYRIPENRGVKRKVDVASIFEMDKLTQPYTFNNVDLEKRRVIITPRGPDPILLGIRGEKPEIVRKAFAIVKPLEPVERWVIFRTNQGTDAHFTKVPALSEIKPYSSVVAKAIVSRNPRLIPLRHVIFSISDDGAEVDCAAYEPTGVLRKIARKLIVGDRVEVYGAVRKRSEGKALTINLEKINVLSLSQKATYENPVCPTCNKRLESIGRGKGFRCKKCRVKFDQARKSETLENRNLEPGLYITSTRSQRHLTKPLRRYGLEKSRNEPVNMVEQWHS